MPTPTAPPAERREQRNARRLSAGMVVLVVAYWRAHGLHPWLETTLALAAVVTAIAAFHWRAADPGRIGSHGVAPDADGRR